MQETPQATRSRLFLYFQSLRLFWRRRRRLSQKLHQTVMHLALNPAVMPPILRLGWLRLWVRNRLPGFWRMGNG